MSEKDKNAIASDIDAIDVNESAVTHLDQTPDKVYAEFEAAAPDPGAQPADEPTLDDMAMITDSATEVGDIMIKPDGLASADTTVAGAIDALVRRKNAADVTYIYVIDQDQILQGVVTLRDLLLARPGQTLGELMTPALYVFSPDTSLFSAVKAVLSTHYRLYPVTDVQGRVVGMVFGWQLFERVANEMNAQAGTMVGLDKEERATTPILTALKMRHPWLQVNLFTAFAAALVVSAFEGTIEKIIALAAFLPVLAGQSGNTGCQALAITLRGLTLGELEGYPTRKLFAKEITLGALNGIGVGILAAIAMFYYGRSTGAEDPFMLSLVILVAMTGACMVSGIFGVAVPLTLKRLGADPAMASSIFLTTMTDIAGMGLMLGLATVLLL